MFVKILLGCLLMFQVTSMRVDAMTAEEVYEQVMQNSHLKVDGQVTGEGFCWHAAYSADTFVTGYLAYGDTAWLDQGVRYFDWLAGLMATGPDGYKGWIGPFIYDKKVWCDVHVGDAILVNPMLHFAEVVLKDEALRKTYGEAAHRYVALAKRDLIEKWDVRGTWHEDGPYGSYASWNRYLAPGDLSVWREIDVDKSTLSLPFNKQFDMGIASLRLWRITQEEQYRDKAERIFRLAKSRMRLVGDHLVWNYWEPTGVWDVADGDLRHWVNVHPYRNYQAGEIHNIVEAYHSGIVYDKTDIERMIRTNLTVMWNGDMENPKWRNSDAQGVWAPPPPPPKGWSGRAGTLWSGLMDFDATIRTLYEKNLKTGTVAEAYYRAVTEKNAVGFGRQFVSDAEARVFDVSFSDGADLTMVAVLPTEIKAGQMAQLVSKSDVSGTLEIALYRPNGDRVAVLYDNGMTGGTDGTKGVFVMHWDGSNVRGKSVSPGQYVIRWTLNGTYREVPVWVR